MTGNRFFTDAEIALHREVEGFCPPDEEPRLNDPPAPGKTCGGCEHIEFLPGELLYGVCHEHEQEVCRYDEACEEREDEE